MKSISRFESSAYQTIPGGKRLRSTLGRYRITDWSSESSDVDQEMLLSVMRGPFRNGGHFFSMCFPVCLNDLIC